MLCTTVKKDVECSFMADKGCTFNGGICHSIVEQCDSCAHIVSYEGAQFCKTYADPSTKWLLGKCNFATNVVKEGVKENKRINPLKESKRRSKGR